MKFRALSAPLLLGLTLTSVHAGVVITSDVLDHAIPDNTDSGYATTLTVPGSQAVSSVTVSLNLSVPGGGAGWIGDLYVYLQHGSDLAVLLNRPGRASGSPDGYDDGKSVAVTFADGAANGDIHTYRSTLFSNEATPLTSPLTGTWQPDGRTTDPAVVLTSSPRNATSLSGFSGQNSDGLWTLFLSDHASGGQYRLDSWSLSVQFAPVPEPRSAAVAVAAALGGWGIWRRKRLKPR